MRNLDQLGINMLEDVDILLFVARIDEVDDSITDLYPVRYQHGEWITDPTGSIVDSWEELIDKLSDLSINEEGYKYIVVRRGSKPGQTIEVSVFNEETDECM